MPSEEERMRPASNLRLTQSIMERLKKHVNPLRSTEVPPDAPIVVQVDNLVKQRDGLCMLCGEILATLKSPMNAAQVAALGPEFAQIVASWERRFAKFSGEESAPTATIHDQIAETEEP